MTDTNDKTSAIIERVKKLLAMAQGNANEHEASTASAMAQKLMEDHNIDMAVLGKSGKGQQGAARKDSKEKGGLYGWQRDLWKASAELNMCVYWSIKGLARGSVYEHRVLGSEVNVLATNIMAGYLQQTIDRLAQEWAKSEGHRSPFVREAIAYREGMTARLVERLRDLRAARLAAEAAKARETKAAAQHPSAAPGTALVLADVIQSEDDLNQDYLRGVEPGTTARERAEHNALVAASQAMLNMWKAGDRTAFVAVYGEEKAQQREHIDAYDAKRAADWELYVQGKDNETYGKPKKARASRSTGYSYRERQDTPAEARSRLSSYGEGRNKAETVGLDQQIDKDSRGRIG